MALSHITAGHCKPDDAADALTEIACGIPAIASEVLAREALERAKASAENAATLARKLGITPQALSQWDRIPHLRVLDVERITGVPRSTVDFTV